MTDTAAYTAAAETTASVNGTAPAADPAAPCEDCATGGERALAAVTIFLGLFVIAVGIDMFTGGKLSGMVPVRGE
jgi:hypothetical protein